MTVGTHIPRRRMLRGFLEGAAVSVALPFLDCFLDSSGRALAATGTALPVCFGTWFQGLGFAPGHWEPKQQGPNYEFGPMLQSLSPLKHKITIFTGLKAFSDGHSQVHSAGQTVGLGGGYAETGTPNLATLDTSIGNVIGLRSRFRSLEVSCDGTPTSFSNRGGNVTNPSEHSPLALYTRIFGPDFVDPNAESFTPDPMVMIRRSALSAVTEQRAEVMKAIGAADKRRLDEYFTSLRATEQQLELQMQKPEPLAACTTPAKPTDATEGIVIDDVLQNHRLFAALLAHAMACGQTQVVNVNLAGALSHLRRAGSANTFHTFTHEEAMDPVLGYQPNVGWFQVEVAKAVFEFISAMDNIKEGDHTLLDRMAILYMTDHGDAKLHNIENIPVMVAGSAGGRIRTGLHINAPGDTMARVGLTLQKALGVSVEAWGSGSNRTAKPIAEIVA